MSTTSTTEISDPGALIGEPVASVVMLAYAHEDVLADAIEGVLSQRTSYPYELLIGEDCSPDRSREIALTYQQRHPDRIRVIYAERNVGGIRNSERLIRAARGEFIAFCEGDDYWHHPDKLQLQIDALRGEPAAHLCHTDYDRRIGRWLLRSGHRRRKPPNLATGDAYVGLLLGMTVKTATAVYRRQTLAAFLDSPFNQRDWPFGDYTKALFAASRGPVNYLPVSTATYRQYLGSAMNAGAQARLRMGQALAQCRELYMEAFPVEAAQAVRIRKVGRQRQMEDGFNAGDREQFLEGYDWLRRNGYPPNPIIHRLRLFALDTRLPLRAWRAVKSLVVRLAFLGS